MSVKVSQRFGVLVGIVAVAVMAVSGRSFVSLREAQTVVRGPGVSRVVPLSTWFDGLRGTAATRTCTCWTAVNLAARCS